MSESLREKQCRFAYQISKLIIWVFDNERLPGYEVNKGDAFRDSRVFGAHGIKKGYGRKWSNHKIKLAQDLNLYINGNYQDETEAHMVIGEKWESMGDDHVWGGHFNDGNHYSFEHNGRK